jgi:hypothetical protein
MKLTPILGPIRSFFAKVIGHVTPRFLKVMQWLVFFCLAAAMLFDPGRDTFGVASAAFAVSLALASVTFTYGRTLPEASAVRDELVFAGERLMSGAVGFLIASILKYASNDVPRYVKMLAETLPARPDGQPASLQVVGPPFFGLMLGILAFIIFVVGLVYAFMGLTILMAVANRRMKRRPGHNEYFVEPMALERHVAGLMEADRCCAQSAKEVA